MTTEQRVKNEIRFLLRQADLEEHPETIKPTAFLLELADYATIQRLYREVVAELEAASHKFD